MTMRRIAQATAGFDPSVNFIGSSPWIGDRSSLGLIIPADPTLDQTKRYLALLSVMEVQVHCVASVRSVRQFLSVGWEAPDPNAVGVVVPVEIPIEVISPTFKYPDGNVSWHLTWQPAPIVFPSSKSTTPDPRSWFNSMETNQPCWLYEQLPVSLGGPGYIPLGGGLPVGDMLSPLGSFHDLRYPWRSVTEPWPGPDVKVIGPGRMMLWASVYQTDPRTRPTPVDKNAEDPPFPWNFLWNAIKFSRFWRVAGELSLDVERVEIDESCQ